jgi:hypothetical protein
VTARKGSPAAPLIHFTTRKGQIAIPPDFSQNMPRHTALPSADEFWGTRGTPSTHRLEGIGTNQSAALRTNKQSRSDQIKHCEDVQKPWHNINDLIK